MIKLNNFDKSRLNIYLNLVLTNLGEFCFEGCH